MFYILRFMQQTSMQFARITSTFHCSVGIAGPTALGETGLKTPVEPKHHMGLSDPEACSSGQL